MKKLIVPFAAVALVISLASAGAQAPSQDDHAAHHPDGGAASAVPGGPMQPGQMPSGQMGMMSMDRMMAMTHGGSMMGGMPTRFVEGRLAFLKTELKITSAQEPQWSKFADAYRSVAQSMKGMEGMMGDQASMPERLTRYERHLTARLDATRTIKAALDPLYAVFTADQKKIADELMGQIGMM
jgi:hypothetical protein